MQAAGSWTEVSTSQFQIFTNGNAEQARAAIAHFEQVRTFFSQASPFQKALSGSVRIVAFASPEEYGIYSPSDSAASFYTKDNDHDEIVMRDLDPDHFNYAVHEYTHLVIARAGVHMPVWMNEGWADLNSTLTLKGRKATVGEIIPGRRDALQSNLWIPLADLDKIDQRSPLYNERSKASVFYGESWALMHMLFLSPEYRGKFNDFVRAIISGKSLVDACPAALGKSVTEVEADLKKYFNGKKLYGAQFAVELKDAQETPAIKAVSALDSGILLADLLALVAKTTQSKAAYEALQKSYPGNPEIDAALGYLTFKTGDQPAGVALLKKALSEGSTDAVMCYRLGVILRASNKDSAGSIAALHRALELKPDYTEARLQLGIGLLQDQNFSDSLRELQQIRKVPEESAPWYFSATAIDDAKLGNPEQARKNIDLARKWAKSPAQITQVEQILHALGGQ